MNKTITRKFENNGADHAPVLAYFAPWRHILELLKLDDMFQADLAKEEWVQVQRTERDGGRNPCPLKIVYRDSQMRGEACTTHTTRAPAPTPTPPAVHRPSQPACHLHLAPGSPKIVRNWQTTQRQEVGSLGM